MNIFLDPRVNENLWVIHEYIARRNPDAAERVIDAAYETFQALADQPGLGKLYSPQNPKLRGIRWRRFKDSRIIRFFIERLTAASK